MQTDDGMDEIITQHAIKEPFNFAGFGTLVMRKIGRWLSTPAAI